MARKDISMSDIEIDEFLERGDTLIVTTLGSTGHPHSTPMWYVTEDGLVVFRSFTKSQKMVNLRRDPRITVLVETGNAYAELQGVMIRGRAELDTDVGYITRLYGRLAAKYPLLGSEPSVVPEDELEALFGGFAAKNTAVRVVPERIATWDHTKLGGVY